MHGFLFLDSLYAHLQLEFVVQCITYVGLSYSIALLHDNHKAVQRYEPRADSRWVWIL